MKKQKILGIIIPTMLLFSCEKPSSNTDVSSYGEYSSMEVSDLELDILENEI